VGPLALLNVRWELTAGRAGAGTLMVQQGGTLTSSWINDIGERAGAEGHVTVTGHGSTWTHRGYVNVGGSHALPGGVGTLSILDSGTVNSQHASIGKMGDAEGTAIVSGEGSTWNISRDILIGYDAKATLTVMDQGSLRSEMGAIGVLSNATAMAEVTGAGSTWHMDDNLYVGSSGTATLKVSAGGTVTSWGGSTMADSEGSMAVAIVSGIGSKWVSTESLHVGGTDSQSGGTALLSVTDGAVVEAGQTLHIWETGTLHGDGIVTAQQLLNAGLIAPGLEADDENGPLFGTLTVEGDYVQDASTGRLRVRLAGNPLHDRLHVDGDVSLAGLLEIVLHDAFIPVVGQTFQVLSWTGSRTGAFDQIAADEPGGGMYWDFAHLYTAGTITLLPEPTSLALLTLALLPWAGRRHRR
jgi:T5SS/PEP-CTERM-associated repeat protein